MVSGFLLCLCALGTASVAQQTGGEACDYIATIKFLNCSSRGFPREPANVPPDTERLDMSGNHLLVLHEGNFRLLWNLRVLLLNDNNISTISNGAFSALGSLRRLDLSHNLISSLSEGFSLGLGTLRELLLAHNQLISLDERSFLHLDNLQKLDLSGNSICCIKVRAFSRMSTLRQLDLQDNQLGALRRGMFSSLLGLEVLRLQGNSIGSTEPGVLTPLTSLVLLDLSHNRLSTIHFKTFLSIRAYSTHILLAHNPWHCDCDLQRVFRKLRSVHRFFLDDYHNLSCEEPVELWGRPLSQVDAELCVAENVTVLVLTATVVVTVLAAIVMAERNKRDPFLKQGIEENIGLEEYADS